MKKYYLPPVIEKNAHKGYFPPDEDTIVAVITTYIATLVKIKGILFKKSAEKLVGYLLIHYPLDIVCSEENNCMIYDPVKKETVKDYGVIGSTVFLLQHPSKTPYTTPYIDIEAGEYSGEEIEYIEEYSIPRLRTGPGRYYLPLIAILLKDKEERLIYKPPLYYLVGFTSKKKFKEFEPLNILIEKTGLSREKIIELIIKYKEHFVTPEFRKKVETGLRNLYDKKTISMGDTLFILTIIEQ